MHPREQKQQVTSREDIDDRGRLFDQFAVNENWLRDAKPLNTTEERRLWLVRANPTHQRTASRA
jgi:hypothetical protein